MSSKDKKKKGRKKRGGEPEPEKDQHAIETFSPGQAWDMYQVDTSLARTTTKLRPAGG